MSVDNDYVSVILKKLDMYQRIKAFAEKHGEPVTMALCTLILQELNEYLLDADEQHIFTVKAVSVFMEGRLSDQPS